MIQTIQMRDFNAAAEKFVQLFEAAGGVATQEGGRAWIAMMKVAPERIRTLVLLGGQRDGLIPMEVTRPPVGTSYWEWVYSPADIEQRLTTLKPTASDGSMRELLKDACKAAVASAAPYAALSVGAHEEAGTTRELDMMQAKTEMATAIAQFGQDSDQARMAMAKAIECLPAEAKAKLNAKARELGLMPPASGYLENGDPVFTIDALAKHFGMEPEQVMRDAAEFSMTVDANSVHRPQ